MSKYNLMNISHNSGLMAILFKSLDYISLIRLGITNKAIYNDIIYKKILEEKKNNYATKFFKQDIKSFMFYVNHINVQNSFLFTIDNNYLSKKINYNRFKKFILCCFRHLRHEYCYDRQLLMFPLCLVLDNIYNDAIKSKKQKKDINTNLKELFSYFIEILIRDKNHFRLINKAYIYCYINKFLA